MNDVTATGAGTICDMLNIADEDNDACSSQFKYHIKSTSEISPNIDEMEANLEQII